MRIVPALAALAAAAVLGACDSPTDGTPDETVFTAEYRLGTETVWRPFTARGQQPSGTESTDPGAWVYTLVDASRNYVWLVPHYFTGSIWVDFSVLVPLLERGDTVDLYDQSVEGPCAAGRNCTYMIVGQNRLLAANMPREICKITEGRMVLTRVTDEWVSATFSGTGTCTSAGVTRAFAVRNGELDVRIPPPPSS